MSLFDTFSMDVPRLPGKWAGPDATDGNPGKRGGAGPGGGGHVPIVDSNRARRHAQAIGESACLLFRDVTLYERKADQKPPKIDLRHRTD